MSALPAGCLNRIYQINRRIYIQFEHDLKRAPSISFVGRYKLRSSP